MVIRTVEDMGMARTLAFWLQSILPQGFLLGWWSEVVLLTVVLNASVLVLIRCTGPTRKIKASWRLLTADAMAIYIYRRYPRIILGSELNIWMRLAKILLLLSPALLPVALLAALLTPAAVSRLSHTPAVVGRPLIVEVRRHAGGGAEAVPTPVADDEILTIDAIVNDPLRDTVWLRIMPIAPGIGFVQMDRDGARIPVNIGRNELAATRLVLAGDREAEIYYEYRRFAGVRHGWLIVMTILSCVLAVPMARWMPRAER